MHLLAAALLFWAAPLFAGELPPEAVAAWQQMNQVKRIEARFEQSRASSLLTKPLVSTGTLRFERPDKLAWVVETPGKSVMILDGSKLGMAYPDLGVREEIELGGDPNVERLVRGMLIWLAGDLDQLRQDYDVTWQAGKGSEGMDLAVLKPRDPAVAHLMGQLNLSIGGQPLQVRAVQVIEPDGDLVNIRLFDIRVDPTLPAAAFSLDGAAR
jgi:outer membrane lipoprotein-sorting protein